MTLTLWDSIYPAQIPSHAAAVAGYVDGDWPTAHDLVSRFPHAHILTIAISAAHDADCLDIETGDATPESAAAWFVLQKGKGAARPCLYANVSTMEADVVPVLNAARIARAEVRLWTAHYTGHPHICGPDSCGALSIDADGTQWTDNALGRDLDESLMRDDFFGATPAPSPAPLPTLEDDMQQLKIGKGASDAFSFDGTPYGNIGFLSDPAGDGVKETTVRVALHHQGKGAEWDVHMVTITPAAPKQVLTFAAKTFDGVKFTRQDDGGAVGVNFA